MLETLSRAITQIKDAILRNPQTPYWYWWNWARLLL